MDSKIPLDLESEGEDFMGEYTRVVDNYRSSHAGSYDNMYDNYINV